MERMIDITTKCDNLTICSLEVFEADRTCQLVQLEPLVLGVIVDSLDVVIGFVYLKARRLLCFHRV